jgi:ribosome-interacting GTPase 1
MLRTIPKHKGTERIQADIKSRIKQFSDELIGPPQGAGAGRLGALSSSRRRRAGSTRADT